MIAKKIRYFLIIFFDFSIFRLKKRLHLKFQAQNTKLNRKNGWFTFMIRYRFHKMKDTDSTQPLTLNDEPKCKCAQKPQKSSFPLPYGILIKISASKASNICTMHTHTHTKKQRGKKTASLSWILQMLSVETFIAIVSNRSFLHYSSLRILSADFVGISCAWQHFSFDDFAILSLHCSNAWSIHAGVSMLLPNRVEPSQSNE